MFSEAKERLHSFLIPEIKTYRNELAPKSETELDVPLHCYVEAAQKLFPDLFALGQAIRKGNEPEIDRLLPLVRSSMPVFSYHFGIDDRPQGSMQLMDVIGGHYPQRLVQLMDAFGVDEQGRLPESDERVDPRILEFFHQFSLVPGNDPKDRSTLVLIPGVEAEDAQDVPYLDTIKKYYGQIVAARQPQTDWYTELAEASILALLLAKETAPSLQQMLPKQLDVAGYSQGGRYLQSKTLRMAYADLQWGTKLLFGYARDVRTTAIIAPASGVDELPWRSQAAVKAVDLIANTLGFWLAKKIQMVLVSDSGRYEIGRSIYITRGRQLLDWWNLFNKEIKRHQEPATIEDFMGDLGLPEGWVMLIISKDDDIVGPSGQALAILLTNRWYPLVGLSHREIPFYDRLWEEMRKHPNQRKLGKPKQRTGVGGKTMISPMG